MRKGEIIYIEGTPHRIVSVGFNSITARPLKSNLRAKMGAAAKAFTLPDIKPYNPFQKNSNHKANRL